MQARPSLDPEPIDLRDGVPFSARYGDVYASRDGALGQARHVFLGGNGLPRRWQGRAQFTVVENGFGLGTNFLATWQAWRDDPARCARLHYLAIELHPPASAALRDHAPPGLASLAAQLAAAWPLPLSGLHRLRFDAGAVTLTLALGDATALVPQLAAGADALYLDGFAPERNPAMWAAPLLKQLARLARPDAMLATWCTARAVREPLAAAGFELELRPGFGRKRQMLAGRYAPRWVVRRHEPPAAYAGERRAVVIGAGMAGSSAALALAGRGWQVDLLEGGRAAPGGASVLPAGLLHPQLAADDSRLARLTRAGFLATLAQLRALDPQRSGWRDAGIFQQADSDAEARGWADAIAAQGLPPAFMQALDRAAAADCLGHAPQRAGLWFPRGAVISGAGWVRSLLAAAGARVTLRTGATAAALADADGRWHVLDADRRTLASAPVVVAANAMGAAPLIGLRHAPVRAVRGRLSVLAGTPLAALRAAVTGDGYAMRAPDGTQLLGATYELDAAEPPPGADPDGDRRAHDGNRARLARLLAAPPAVDAAGVFDGFRAVATDRLPLAGAVADEADAAARRAALRGAHLDDLPRRPGIFGLFALGSRGMVLAPLLADLVAAQIEGEPWPIERDLAASVDPARFLLARLRAGRLA